VTERTSFYRKIGYGIAIVALCFLLGWISRPATATNEGGQLAQLRKEYGLAQVNLGEVDPASETIKLATLGLRGVAVNLLWEKANHYKKVEDWTNLTATLEQLAKLQPNFITFWKFQAWNLTYNVSVEFDDYNDRYYYVRRGIEFLKEGENYNTGNPVLLWDLGWFVGQKIGRADEYVQYRRLFKRDDDFHPSDRPQEQRDNWLVGKEHYLDAIDSVDNKGFSLGRKSPRDFYSSPAKSQMNYAEAIEEEGYFPLARRAWARAAEEWRQFGNTFIEHSTGVKMRLGTQPQLEKQVADLRAKIEALRPGTREELVKEKRQALTEDERQILDTPAEKLTPQQNEKLYTLQEKTTVTDRDVAERIAREQPADEKQVLMLANDLDRTAQELQFTINYKRDANYDYWQNRADFEQTDNALAAREFMFNARRAFEDADLPRAKQFYQQGFAKWRQVIDAFPSIMEDDQTTGDDILEFIKKYRDVLDQLDERLDDDFPLWDVIEKFDREQEFTEEKAERRERLGLPPEQTTPPEAAAAPADGTTPPAQPVPPASESTPSAAQESPAVGSSQDAPPQNLPTEPAESSPNSAQQ
jgi:hypothetical protein